MSPVQRRIFPVALGFLVSLGLALGLAVVAGPGAAGAGVLTVGQSGQYATIAAAVAASQDGDVIEVAAGNYPGDVLSVNRQNLTISAVGGPVVVDSAGRLAQQVGIWQVTGGSVRIEGVTFQGASGDGTASGIRLTDGELTVVRCKFFHNEMGILTANRTSIRLTVQDSEFGFNAIGDGYTHNLYAGRIDQVTVTGSYFHNVIEGHLFKSRARTNLLLNNRFSDENDPTTSQASYEIDLPDGGRAVVVGNIVQQAATTQNNALVDFAGESQAVWPVNELYLANNTFISNVATTKTMLVGQVPATVFANNLVNENLNPPTATVFTGGNQVRNTSQLTADYAPTAADEAAWVSVIIPNLDNYLPSDLKALGASLIPTKNYVHPSSAVPIYQVTLPGAIQPASALIPPTPTITASQTNTGTATNDPGSTGSTGSQTSTTPGQPGGTPHPGQTKPTTGSVGPTGLIESTRKAAPTRTALSVSPTGQATSTPKASTPANQVVKVRLSQTRLVLAKGKSTKIRFGAYRSDGSRAPATIKAAKAKLVKVSKSGKIKAKRVGTTKVTVTAANGLKANLKVTVLAAKPLVKVTKVKVKSVPKAQTVGQVSWPKVSWKSARVAGVRVKYDSSNRAILKVDPAGRVQAIAPGQAKLIVKIGPKTKSITITVR